MDRGALYLRFQIKKGGLLILLLMFASFQITQWVAPKQKESTCLFQHLARSASFADATIWIAFPSFTYIYIHVYIYIYLLYKYYIYIYGFSLREGA